MAEILQNEMIYNSGVNRIWKTYEPDSKRFGLFWQFDKKYRYADANYIHIFNFENERAAAITAEEEFVWIDKNLKQSPMDLLDERIWECMPVRNARCNCLTHGNVFECQLCIGGVIFNNYNWKRCDDESGETLFHYSTELGTYLITLTPEEKNSSLVKDVWEENEFEQELRWVVDEYETKYIELESHFRILLVSRLKGSNHADVTPFTVTIEILSSSFVDNPYINRTILGYDDYPYDTD